MKVNGVSGPHHPVVREMLSTRMFNKADQDASGGLNVDEFKALAAKGPGAERRATRDLDAAFTSIDADADGSLTKTEMGDAWSAFKAKIRTTVSMHGEGAPTPPTSPTPPTTTDMPAPEETTTSSMSLLMKSSYAAVASSASASTLAYA